HAAYSKDESIMSNCHVRIAYAPNKVETAKVLSDMTGKTTVVTKKTSLSGSRSGHLGRASVSVGETGRALLTPDECMRLPGAKKDTNMQIIEAGDMLVFPAGFPPIYGRQILYFLDPVFSERAKVKAPLASDRLVPEEKKEEGKDSSPVVYTVEPAVTKSSEPDIPEYDVEDEPVFEEEATYDGEEPDFDEFEIEEPDFEEKSCA
ncbi:type IV secretory system conjugative DNA transfer family protein, partial [Halodesulfovibrio sp.]|uniref:type IV secretory system conjugative DNA transfer family protein n=1 Tax=Halodesulfovibrio sp. TaxID=1912772 RepID=UPI0025C546E9